MQTKEQKDSHNYGLLSATCNEHHGFMPIMVHDPMIWLSIGIHRDCVLLHICQFYIRDGLLTK